jgi:hypothetical protein
MSADNQENKKPCHSGDTKQSRTVPGNEPLFFSITPRSLHSNTTLLFSRFKTSNLTKSLFRKAIAATFLYRQPRFLYKLCRRSRGPKHAKLFRQSGLGGLGLCGYLIVTGTQRFGPCCIPVPVRRHVGHGYQLSETIDVYPHQKTARNTSGLT